MTLKDKLKRDLKANVPTKDIEMSKAPTKKQIVNQIKSLINLDELTATPVELTVEVGNRFNFNFTHTIADDDLIVSVLVRDESTIKISGFRIGR